MKHLGDITKIDGHKVPIVDCCIGGSPCQDLSMAGKRAGLDGERSGLFMEQIRIIKEMREEDERRGNAGVDIRPRYMVWENVPGAFSSNKGEDFRIVLEETAKVADKDAVIPRPDKGKWTTSGCVMGDGWSIAWRVLDSQFFGTSDKPLPQRRRRIALIADFGGHSAPEILFVRQSVSGNIEPSEPKRKGASQDTERGFGESDSERAGINCYTPWDSQTRRTYSIDGVAPSICAGAVTSGQNHQAFVIPKTDDRAVTFEPGIASREGGHIYEGVSGTLRANADDNQMATAYTLKIRSGCEGGGKGALIQEDKSATLSTLQDQTLFQPVVCLQGAGTTSQNSKGSGWKEGESYTLNTTDVHGVVYSIENHPADSRVNIDESGKVQCLTSRMGTGGGNVPMVMEPVVPYRMGGFADYVEGEIGTLKASGGDLGGGSENLIVAAVDCRNGTENPDINGTLQTHPAGGTSLNLNNVVRTNYIVRRLTPLECERLQGFPDGWTDIGEWTDSKGKVKKTSDAARYKALGNSIALPPWKWVLKRLCACYERDATMASLFDGIGGFPYIWEQLNGKGSCLWASEIEDFPIAVTKVRFGECT